MGTKCHPMSGPNDKCPIVGVLPVAEYPHQEPYPGAAKLTDGWGCSAQGLGVANYGGMEKTYIVGDWCSGRVWGIAWDKGANKWQMQELMQATFQFTAGTTDEKATCSQRTASASTRGQGPDSEPARRVVAPDAGQRGEARHGGRQGQDGELISQPRAAKSRRLG